MQKRPSPGWPFISQQAPDAPHAISLSGLVYGFLDRIFHFAYSLLAFAFELLSLAFSTQLVIVGRFLWKHDLMPLGPKSARRHAEMNILTFY